MNRDQTKARLTYWLFYRQGYPLFALPVVDNRIRFALWRYFPAERFKWLIRYIQWFDRFGLCRWMARQTEDPLASAGLSIDTFLGAIKSSTGCSPTWCVFVWPSAQRSKDRLYAYLLDAENRCVGFVKLAKTKEESVRLQREIAAAKAFASEKPPDCGLRIPKLLGDGHIGTNGAFVVMEPIPNDAQHIHFNESGWTDFGLPCKQKFSGEIRYVTSREIEQQPWWQQYRQRSNQVPFFHEDVLTALGSPVAVVKTHGDFLGHNFRRTEDQIWVFDWEEYTDCGPFLVDEIGFFLCVYRYGLNKSVQEVNQLFIENYLRKGGDKCRDAVLALAFLFGANIAMAQDIVSLWQPLSKNTR